MNRRSECVLNRIHKMANSFCAVDKTLGSKIVHVFVNTNIINTKYMASKVIIHVYYIHISLDPIYILPF